MAEGENLDNPPFGSRMSSETTFSPEAVQAGYDAVAIKYLSTAVGTILLYDYFLTFSDEVRFWQGRKWKGWAFYLFLFNHYCPILYEIWIRCVLEDLTKCEITVKIQRVCFLLFLLGGQVSMIPRLYAISGQQHAVLAILPPIALAQLVLGLITVFSSYSSATPGVSMKVAALRMCFFTTNARVVYAYIGLALLFDATLFLWITTVVFGSTHSFRIPSYLLRKIMQEASIYFLVMVCSHIIVVMFQVLGSDTPKTAPTLVVMIITPVMVSRMVLSLANSAGPLKYCRWELDHFTVDSVSSDLSLNFEAIRISSILSQGEGEA